jgi:hypothetical protein
MKQEKAHLLWFSRFNGGLSNFDGVCYSDKGYKIVIPTTHLLTKSLKTNVKSFKYKTLSLLKVLTEWFFRELLEVIFIQNVSWKSSRIVSPVAQVYKKAYGDSYPKRGDYEYIKKKAEDVFYDPKIATQLNRSVCNCKWPNKLIKTLTIAKSAIRHNMAKDLPKMHVQTCN